MSAVDIVANFVSAIAASAAISAFEIPDTAIVKVSVSAAVVSAIASPAAIVKVASDAPATILSSPATDIVENDSTASTSALTVDQDKAPVAFETNIFPSMSKSSFTSTTAGGNVIV